MSTKYGIARSRTMDEHSRKSVRIARNAGWACVVATVVACTSAACSSEEGPADTVVEEPDGGPATLGDVPDTGTKDATAVDSSQAFDAGPPPDAGPDADDGWDPFGEFPDGGTECTPRNLVQERACANRCYRQARVCLPDPDGGAPVWQPWGECLAATLDLCTPGETRTVDCGFCGKRVEKCGLDCSYSASVCTGEGACEPGKVERTPNLSCDNGWRERTCTDTCQWGSYGPCKTVTGDLVLPTTLTAEVSANFELSSDSKLGRAYGSCPLNVDNGNQTAYRYVTIANPSAQAAAISIWAGPAPDGPAAMDTIMTAYSGGTAPANDAARALCSRFNDDCYQSPCVGSGFSGLINGDVQTVPAFGQLTLYVAGFNSGVSGHLLVHARLDTLF